MAKDINMAQLQTQTPTQAMEICDEWDKLWAPPAMSRFSDKNKSLILNFINTMCGGWFSIANLNCAAEVLKNQLDYDQPQGTLPPIETLEPVEIPESPVVDVAAQNRKLRGMTSEELREQIRSENKSTDTIRMPREFTPDVILGMSPSRLAHLQMQYGSDAVKARLKGER
jgi:hypothetical protein